MSTQQNILRLCFFIPVSQFHHAVDQWAEDGLVSPPPVIHLFKLSTDPSDDADVFDCLSEPCIRGHRSTKCDHAHERVMVPVRKPGRPLHTCSHPGKNCRCVTVAIPRKRKCECSRHNESGVETPRSRSQSPLDMMTPARVQRIRDNDIIHHHCCTINQASSVNDDILPEAHEPPDNNIQPRGSRHNLRSTGKAQTETPDQRLIYSPSPTASGQDITSKVTKITGDAFPGSKQAKACCCSADDGGSPPREVVYATPAQSCCSPRNNVKELHKASTFGVLHESETIWSNHNALPTHDFPPGEAPNAFREQQVNTPGMARLQGVPLNFQGNGYFTQQPGGMMSGLGNPVVVDRQMCTNCLNQPVTILMCPPPYQQTAPANPLGWQQMARAGGLVYVILRSNPQQATRPNDFDSMSMTFTQQPPVHQSSLLDTVFECSCGPGCQCIGCIAHPYNDAMQKYIWSACSSTVETATPFTAQNDSVPGEQPNNLIYNMPTPMASLPKSTSSISDAESQMDEVLPADDFFFVEFPEFMR